MTNTVAIILVTELNGRLPKNSNSATEESRCTASSRLVLASCMMLNNAALPIKPIQIRVNPVGISRTPTMNSRILRPSDNRAINIPTNGDQEIHQAQYIMVQPPIQPLG